MKANGAAITIGLARAAYVYVSYRYCGPVSYSAPRPSLHGRDARRRRHFLPSRSGHSHQYRGACLQCFLHQHHVAVRRRGHRRLGHHRSGDAGRFRRAVCARGRDRTGDRPELGCAQLRPGAPDLARFADFMAVYVGGRLDGSLPHPRAADAYVQCAAPDERSRAVLLPDQRVYLVLHRAGFRRQRLVQQSRISLSCRPSSIGVAPRWE